MARRYGSFRPRQIQHFERLISPPLSSQPAAYLSLPLRLETERHGRLVFCRDEVFSSNRIDTETQARLNLLADSIATAKVLLLVNYRPEYPTSS